MNTTDHSKKISPISLVAQYKEQMVPRFRGNALIEALPLPLSNVEIFKILKSQPNFDPEQRAWEAEHRIDTLGTLQDFMVPLDRHLEVARSLGLMLRNGYVGRAPQTLEQMRKNQEIYEGLHTGEVYQAPTATNSTPYSALLIGVAGMGKTKMVKRWFSHIPPVIYHPEYHLYQVTHLHVEMPSDGSSVKGLASGILRKMDKLVPGAKYYEMYFKGGRPSAETLMQNVAHVLDEHRVGFLICDEVQNLANSHKGVQTVMTEIVTACNEMGVPILFIGTNKATKVFSRDFRLSRRASGNGIQPWNRLSATTGTGSGSEWRDFISILWKYQWTRKPVALDEYMLDTMYHCSQGVIDIAIKLFAATQARAIIDGTEQITSQLITTVFDKEFQLLHPMVEALRDDNLERLAMYDDIAPFDLSENLAQARTLMQGKRSNAYSIKPGDAAFVHKIASSLVQTGFGEEESVATAEAVAAQGKAKNLFDGAKLAHEMLTAPKSVQKPKKKATPKDEATELDNDFSSNPADYRQAIVDANKNGTSIYDELQGRSMAVPLDKILELT